MKHTTKVRRLTLSIMGLFGANKPIVTFLNRKDEYFKDCWFNKKLCDGVELVALIEQINKKQACEMLMKASLSSYMGAKLTKQIEDDRAAKELDQNTKLTRFQMVLRRFAREHGMDISKLNKYNCNLAGNFFIFVRLIAFW